MAVVAKRRCEEEGVARARPDATAARSDELARRAPRRSTAPARRMPAYVGSVAQAVEATERRTARRCVRPAAATLADSAECMAPGGDGPPRLWCADARGLREEKAEEERGCVSDSKGVVTSAGRRPAGRTRARPLRHSPAAARCGHTSSEPARASCEDAAEWRVAAPPKHGRPARLAARGPHAPAWRRTGPATERLRCCQLSSSVRLEMGVGARAQRQAVPPQALAALLALSVAPLSASQSASAARNVLGVPPPAPVRRREGPG